MTLTQLQYALALQKHQNFKRAAEHLFITQPALSIQIQKLEESIGIKLFNRNATPLETTVDGKLFLIRAQDIVNNARQLENFVSELKEDYSGELNVGIIPTLAPFLVPLFSGSLQSDYPQLQLIFHEQITESVVRSVRTGELDVGIISTPIEAYGIQSIPLFYERFFAYASDDQSVSSPDIKLEDINSAELWILDEGNCFRDQVNDFCDLQSVLNDKKFIYHSNSIDALIRMVDTHGGITILPELTTMSLSEYQEDNLKTISGRPKAREIGMIVTQNYGKARYINLLEEYIKSNIPNHMLSGDSYDVVDPHLEID